MTTKQPGDDIESGARFRLNTESYEDHIDPIPSLEPEPDGTSSAIGGGDDPTTALTPSSSTDGVAEHTVITRMTTFEYMWRRNVRSRTNNTTVQAMLDHVLMLFLFFASLVEKPLNHILGSTSSSNTDRAKSSLQPRITRGTAKTRLGTIAYKFSQGRHPNKHPILCFHSAKRSSDEYLELLPLLATTGRRVVALDLLGHGWSDNPRRSCTMDDMADAILQVADTLLIESFVCVGSSIGTRITTSLASRYPNRVMGCIHVHLLYDSTSNNVVSSKTNENENQKSTHNSVNNDFTFRDDGSHLIDLHTKRKFLEPELNLRCVQSDLAHVIHRRARLVDGITMEDEQSYDLESAARKLKCPTLCVSGEAALASLDARGMGGTQRFDTACRLLPHCEVNTLTGPRSTMYVLNQAPKEFASLCTGFLEKHSL